MRNNYIKLKGLLRLLRFELPFSAGVCVVMGQILAFGKFASISEIAFGFFSVFLISASILVLNDYFDVETDKLNAPHRPIPSNAVTPSEALLLSLILMLCGIILSYLISFIALLFSVILLIVGFLYNRTYKKSGLPGNLMVSFSVGMTFIYGGVSVGLPFNNVVWLFGLIAALIDLGEEIAADAMDMQGDLLINSNSLAIKYGKQVAIQKSSYIFFFVILLTSVPFILRWLPAIYLVPVAIMDTSIAYSSLRLLESSDNKDSGNMDLGRKYIRWIYLGATLGLLVFISMRLLEALK
ncbi:UbiA family prenyltransferase [uncultured Methanomethylovorans sp.]|uniref:UbiA family prenyltransferase n=1 Tax=uncultured Methanomethylovorans sp. TaxID=183759 RepID=UPI002AA6BD7D|nr:UbiA family prenyltransferase [uncultured Methanomethylovorans sp.]